MKRADPETVAAWVHGWSITRSVTTPTVIPGGLRVDVGLPEHASRSILHDSNPATVVATMDANRAPWNFIKVCSEPEALTAIARDPWIVDDHVWMMVGPSVSKVSTQIAPQMALSLRQDGDLIKAEAHDENGILAAHGKGAVAFELLVFDQIVTEPAYRRRGLASVIMSAIGSAASDSGVGNAVLVATQEGVALYSALGWRIETSVTSIVVPGARQST